MLIKAFHVLVVAYVLLFVYFARFAPIDHDEVEHAHVAFKMLGGQLPYRDFYQNHLPAYWFLVMPLVNAFPLSIHCLLAARGLCLLGLAVTWYLGLGLLGRTAGGRTYFTRLVYTLATIQLAYHLQFYTARPDPFSTLFATWALCLVPVPNGISWRRSLAIGMLLGVALSISTKVFPLLLLPPLGFAALAIRDRNPQLVGPILPYGVGILIAVLPTAVWVVRHDLLRQFVFDTVGMNAALSKPWFSSFRFVFLPAFVPALLGVVALVARAHSRRWASPVVPLLIATWLALGLSIALVAGHPSEYNIQVITIPAAIGVAFLVAQAWLRIRDTSFRLLLCAALLGYPTLVTAKAMLKLKGAGSVPLPTMQRIVDLARPGNRTCTAFSPVHPIFCSDVSGLSNGWDLTFALFLGRGTQRDRILRVWLDGLRMTVEQKPDIVVWDDGRDVWRIAVGARLITSEDFDALRAIGPHYEVEKIEAYRIWRKK
jgi:hypothetical protein